MLLTQAHPTMLKCLPSIMSISLIPGPSPVFVIRESLGTGLCIDIPGVGSAKFSRLYF